MANFQDIQRSFTAHIRQPDTQPIPHGVEPRRMKIYSELFYNNIEGLLANSYPVLKLILNNTQWHRLIRTYFAHHRAQTPLFPHVPQAFLQYLHESHVPQPDEPVFLTELAHYEWVELAVAIDDREVDLSDVNHGASLLEGVIILNPTMMLLAYTFPVHKICPDYQPAIPLEEPTYLVVYRDTQDHVNFIHLNAVSARLLELLQKNLTSSGREILERVAADLSHPQPDKVIQGGTDILHAWQVRGLVLGCRIHRD